MPTSQAVDRLKAPAAGETFSGEIQGLKASDLEERFARSWDKRGYGYDFRTANVVGRNLPGEVELDFSVDLKWAVQPVQIDGLIGHKTAEQKAEADAKDAILNDELRGTGALPVIRIAEYQLVTQELSDRVVDDILAGRLYSSYN